MKNKPERKPPKHLGAEGRAFFRRCSEEFEFSGEPFWRLLEEASACVDRIAQCRVILSTEGLVSTTGAGGAKKHPAADIEVATRTLLTRILRELQFSEEPAETRLPRSYSQTSRRR